jgi:hypothetical protein
MKNKHAATAVNQRCHGTDGFCCSANGSIKHLPAEVPAGIMPTHNPTLQRIPADPTVPRKIGSELQQISAVSAEQRK